MKAGREKMITLELTETEAHLLMRAVLIGLKGVHPALSEDLASDPKVLANSLTSKILAMIPAIEKSRVMA